MSTARSTTVRTLTRLAMIGAASTAVLFSTTACTIFSVPADSVEEQIVTQLGAQGVSFDGGTADCPGDLDAEVGAGQTCEFRTGGQPVGAVVTVTAVDDDDVSFDITTEARPVPRALLEETVASTVAAEAGVPVAFIDSTECDGDLPASTDGRVACTLNTSGEQIPVAVHVTGIQGGQVDFEIVDA
ncbi:DUF4333 domain-containing protein [Pseudonocardia nematodicida]|uniref:DUF4333 domain-containing protein n=1 Tax=Pseudonocardia nematodicida TaxID=1206997 RepID=A0ABV1KF70_9PSEU